MGENLTLLSRYLENQIKEHGEMVKEYYTRAIVSSANDCLKLAFAALILPRGGGLILHNGETQDHAQNTLSFKRQDQNDTKPKAENRQERLENYIAPGNVGVYLNQKERWAEVYVDSRLERNGAHWFRVISALPLLCPWCFDKEPLTPEEYAFLQEISKFKKFEEAEMNILEKAAAAIVKARDIKRGILVGTIQHMVSGSRDARLKAIKNDIDSYTDNIAAYQRRIDEYIDHIREQRLIYKAVEAQDDTTQIQELIDFLQSGDIEIDYNDTDGLRFYIRTTLSCYDEDEVEPYIYKEDKVLKGRCSWRTGPDKIYMPYTKEQMLAFYKAVFDDQRFQIKLISAFFISQDAKVTSETAERDHDTDYILNPNLGYANCLGGYHRELDRAKEHHDFIAALSICQQSGMSVNLGEVWPMARITQDLVLSKGKVIQTADSDITFKEAMQRIIDEMKQEEPHAAEAD